MMWVCRSGKHGICYDDFIKDERIYLVWDGYKTDLSEYSTIKDFRNLVIAERNPESFTTISNWACQLKAFCTDMRVNDYVLVPSKGSKSYILCKIIGDYEYHSTEKLPHSHKICIILSDIPRTIFPQDIQYSLGAFRTVFKVRQENRVVDTIYSIYKLDSIMINK